MIDQQIYTKEYIQSLTDDIKADRNLVERSLYAFGLLEALSRVKLPFIFKGGTCLLLLLNNPKRLSTDIDIIVDPTINIDSYLIEAEKIFPFRYMEESKRKGRNNIEKRHFRFYYDSPIQLRESNILLDVVYENNPYSKIISKEITNTFLITIEPKVYVNIPSIECILGDKLTAFAPYTTGIPFNVDKELEIIKQLNDVASLFDQFQDYSITKDTYIKTAFLEIGFRGLDINYTDCLKDSIRSCLSIMSKGSILRNEYYNYFLEGTRRIKGHILGYKYNPDIAVDQAAKVLYLSCCLLSDTISTKELNLDEFRDKTTLPNNLKSLFYLKRFNYQAFVYLCESLKIVNLEDFI